MSALLAMGVKPLYAPRGFPVTPDAIRTFLNGLDWGRPWDAGAQTGHLLFFLKHGDYTEAQRQEGFSAVIEFLNDLESPETGGWYCGIVANRQIINGAMKIASGLYWWNEPARYAEPLLASALAEANDDHDCMLTNRIFVLHFLQEQLGSLPVQAKDIAWRSLESIPQFFQPDGGLAGSPEGSLSHYYYARVSEGRQVGDLHGLALLTWGIALAAHILGEHGHLQWRPLAP